MTWLIIRVNSRRESHICSYNAGFSTELILSIALLNLANSFFLPPPRYIHHKLPVDAFHVLLSFSSRKEAEFSGQSFQTLVPLIETAIGSRVGDDVSGTGMQRADISSEGSEN